MTEIYIGIIGGILLILILIFILYRHYYHTKIDEYKNIQDGVNQLQSQKNELSQNIQNLNNEKQTIETNLQYANIQLTTVNNNLVQLQDFYKENQKLLENNFDDYVENLNKKYYSLEEECREEYLLTMKDFVADLQNEVNEYTIQIQQLQESLMNYQLKVDASVEASKRELEKEQNKDFYKLTLTDTDIQEIKKLREILPYFRNAEPINKVIYKIYYEKPYTDLIGRVIGQRTITGIYKITNITNNMCYVGQAVNIAERWKQHIKRGVGAETPTQNKLYPVMYELGPENFTFEVIEICGRPQLNEREQYWQGIYHAKDFGYSIK